MIEYPTKILLATDGGEDSVTAAEAAVALSNKTGAELHVVNVGQAQSSGPGVTVEGRTAQLSPTRPSWRGPGGCSSGRWSRSESTGGTVAETHLRIRSPPYEVVGLSDEIGTDMIVVGSGRPRAVRRAVSGTIRRAAIGAVADYIVRSAHCPVLVVRGDGILRSVVPHPDTRDAAPTGEPEAIGDLREEDRL